MSDLISRQAAIDAVEFGITYAKAINKETGEVRELFKQSNEELRKAVERIKALPSIQPEQNEMIRQEQCDKVCRILDDVLANRPTERDSLIVVTRKAFDALEQSKWTLCSERMPEEHEWIGTKRFGTTISDEVYVTFEAPDGQRFADHISFQNGKLSRSDEHRMKVVFKGAKPIAWLPLPEPYKGEQE